MLLKSRASIYIKCNKARFNQLSYMLNLSVDTVVTKTILVRVLHKYQLVDKWRFLHSLTALQDTIQAQAEIDQRCLMSCMAQAQQR